MQTSESLISQLEAAVQNGSQEQRIAMMRQVTALFLGGADRLSSKQVALFDDILTRLTEQVESKALVELGVKLAPISNAPNAVLNKLARHNEIAVAGPVLAQSSALSDHDLIEIAKTKSQDHLGAISERKRIATAVTDILVDRGNNEVVFKLSRNAGASFSDAGFSTLAKRAETDEKLAENLGLRTDISPQLFHQLVLKATDAVRRRLLASAKPEVQATIRNVLESVSSEFMQAAPAARDFRRAEATIAQLKNAQLLDEHTISSFASTGKYEEMVVGLAQLSSASVELIEKLMQGADDQGILVACKAAQIHWPTTAAILKHKSSGQRAPAGELEQLRADYLKLSVETAQRMVRFWIVRGVATYNVNLAN